jgi:hypothetical protein
VHTAARLVLALLLLFGGSSVALAQSDDQSGAQSSDQQPEQPAAPQPTLTADDSNPLACDNSRPALRYDEIRGTAFYGYASQRLPGVLTDSDGNAQATWKTIWVNPQGNLTVLINLCEDDFLSRPPLAVGDYLVSINDPTTNDPIAQTMISVQESPTDTLVPTPNTTPGAVTPPPTPQATPAPAFAPPPAATPTAAAAVAATATAGPRTGLGSQQQPLPVGALADLGDGWKIQVTGVTPDAWSSFQNYNSNNKGPPTNLQFFMVRLQASYTGSEATPIFAPFRLRLMGPSGTYDNLDNSCGLIPDDLSQNQYANGVVRGNICFAVRTSDVGQLLMYDFQQSETDRLYLGLK